jgi:hypothetical protein
MQIVGADVSSISLGDLSFSKGAGGNLQTASENLRETGLRKLRELGKKMHFYVSNN